MKSGIGLHVKAYTLFVNWIFLCTEFVFCVTLMGGTQIPPSRNVYIPLLNICSTLLFCIASLECFTFCSPFKKQTKENQTEFLWCSRCFGRNANNCLNLLLPMYSTKTIKNGNLFINVPMPINKCLINWCFCAIRAFDVSNVTK